MINNKLTISLVLLLSLTGGAFARFLQPSNSTTVANATGPMVISTQPSTSNITYNGSLLCGECIVGNYVFCINGPANYTGSAVP